VLKNKVTFDYLSSLENMNYIFYLEKEIKFLFLEIEEILIFIFLGRLGIYPHSYIFPGAMRK